MKEFLISRFGEDWYELLKDFLMSDDMKKIAFLVDQRRRQEVVIPPKGSELLFKMFKDLQPDKINTLVLGQD